MVYLELGLAAFHFLSSMPLVTPWGNTEGCWKAKSWRRIWWWREAEGLWTGRTHALRVSAVWLWPCHLTSLISSFFICKVEAVPTSVEVWGVNGITCKKVWLRLAPLGRLLMLRTEGNSWRPTILVGRYTSCWKVCVHILIFLRVHLSDVHIDSPDAVTSPLPVEREVCFRAVLS